MPMKFGKNRPKDKKVFGDYVFSRPGQVRRGAGLAEASPVLAGQLPRRLPGAPVDENLKVVGFAPNFAGGTPWTHVPRP